MARKIGINVFPYDVNEYNTSGVFPVLIFLARIPSASISRNCSVKTFCAASGTSRRNSPNLRGPPFSANKMIGFHLPSITSTVVLTRQSFNRINPRKLRICAYWTHSIHYAKNSFVLGIAQSFKFGG